MRSRIVGYLVVSAAVVLISGACTAMRSNKQQAPPPLLQVRMASDVPRAEHDSMAFASNGRAVFVRRTNVVADDMIAHVDATKVDGGLVLDVTFTPDGARRLADATRGQIGQLIAVLLDSRLVAAAPIMSPLGSPRVTIAAQVSPELVTELQEKVKAKWPGEITGSDQVP